MARLSLTRVVAWRGFTIPFTYLISFSLVLVFLYFSSWKDKFLNFTMPLTEADQKRVDKAKAEAKAAGSSSLVVRAPADSQKLGSFSVICLILNRTIGRENAILYA